MTGINAQTLFTDHGSPIPGNVLAIIPARGGSKGIPRKNVLPLAGQPLIAYNIQQALQLTLHHPPGRIYG